VTLDPELTSKEMVMFNLARSLDRNADRTPHEAAVIFRDTRLTHLQLLDRVNALAAAFRAAGVGKGDIVALLMGNRPEFLESALAVNRVGAVFLPLNVRLAEPELEYIIRHADAAAIVTEPGLAGPVAAISGRLTTPWTVVVAGEGEGATAAGVPYESFLSAHRGASLPPADVTEADLHRLMYSSGTTAHPKGVPITYGNFYWKTIGHVAEFGISAADRTVMAGPMYHVGAFDLPGIGTWWVGGSLVILPRFDVPDLLDTVERERPTNVWLAPAMVNATLNAIAQSPELGQRSTASIRFITGGGEKMPLTLIERLLAAFPNARFADAYGLTETVSGDTFNDQAHTLSKIGSVGKPVVNLDVRILGPDDAPVEPGAQGEIALRGPKVVSGYWKNPDATQAAFTADGWFRTGDIGHLDKDGYLYIDDRKKDMIVSGGENVATSEVERVVYECGAVLEAAVVAMPDARWGEVPRAFVVLRPGQEITEQALIAHCRSRLAGFKTPKQLVFMEMLPRNPSGKVLKRQLREINSNAEG
jgi:acyl-CoA synthetase (AMP-forming)/AMP-acid ligase II